MIGRNMERKNFREVGELSLTSFLKFLFNLGTVTRIIFILQQRENKAQS